VQTTLETGPELTCSQWSLDLAEPLAGTASPTRGYLLIEQSGPWGRDALVDSALDPALTATLTAELGPRGLTPLLIRRPGRSPDRTHRRGRQVFAAVLGDEPVTVAFRVADVAELASLSWAQFEAAGLPHIHPDAVPVTAGLALVCAHARRDRCCAAKGRPLAAYLDQLLRSESAATSYEPVWECSHLGGHRLAPTALLLPIGAVYGRLNQQSLYAAHQAAQNSRVLPDLLRGMARYPKPVQAAEVAVRLRAGIDSADCPELVDRSTDGELSTVLFRDAASRYWRVVVREQPVAIARPESCAKSPARPTVCTVEQVVSVAGPRIDA
jgi:hypothetical protein